MKRYSAPHSIPVKTLDLNRCVNFALDAVICSGIYAVDGIHWVASIWICCKSTDRDKNLLLLRMNALLNLLARRR